MGTSELNLVIGAVFVMLALFTAAWLVWRRREIGAVVTEVLPVAEAGNSVTIGETEMLTVDEVEVPRTDVLPYTPPTSDQGEETIRLPAELPAPEGTIFVTRQVAPPTTSENGDATTRLSADQLFGDRGGWTRGPE